MNIIKNGVELNAEEFLKFFEDHSEVESLVHVDRTGLVIGDVMAITNDDRLALDVDNGSTEELYSKQFCDVAVTKTDENQYTVKII